jgi:hypothetical protein
MDEDEKQRLVDSVAEAHLSVSEVLSKLRRQLSPKAPALKAAVKAERELFQLRRQLQQLDLDDATRPERLSEVTRGGKPGC